jgi:hypothetical protein
VTEAVIVALISGGFAFLGTVITSNAAAKKTERNIAVNQAVTDEKITELTREVREHNNFAQRMPVVENQIKTMCSDIQELKGYHKPKQ